MPEFRNVNPEEALVGRTAIAQRALAPYLATLEDGDAGIIYLSSESDKTATVKRRLAEAAKRKGVRVRSSVTEAGDVVWKKVGS